VAAGACGSGGEHPSILLLTLDTTRTDALSCYDAESGAATPHLDRLAAEGILFESAFTSAPLTLPAHASILSGLYPLRHGVRDNGMGALPGAADTLAERALAAGYQTAAFVGSVVLDAPFGLDQGFELYDVPPPRAQPGREAERSARAVVNAALAWFHAREPERPFLLWLHFYDPHTPYAAPTDVEGCRLPGLPAGLRSEYLREVCAMDHEIGRVLAALEEERVLDRTLVLAVGDHGEAFGEHDEQGHSVYCYDTTLRVPMLLRLPAGEATVPRGLRRTDVVSVVDALPTLLEAAGLALPRDLDGTSLLHDEVPADRGVYFESYYGYLAFGWSPLAGWLDANAKYVHTSDPELYDRTGDPDELTNLHAERGADARPYQVAIARLAEKKPLPRSDDAFDEDLLEDLRGLGYVAGGTVATSLPHPLDDSELPSPLSMGPWYERTLDALARARDGRVEEALAALQEVREVNDRNPFVLEEIAGAQLQLGRTRAAAATLRHLIDVSLSERPGAWFRLGRCLRAEGDLPGAIEALEEAVRLIPDRPRFLRELIDALEEAGRGAEADALAHRLAELDG
jgi:arylsulfatase A-like enzyme